MPNTDEHILDTEDGEITVNQNKQFKIKMKGNKRNFDLDDSVIDFLAKVKQIINE